MILTIFTPTYNREHTLRRLYFSILSQNIRDFEWIIVDDGSTDDTEKLIQSFDNNEFNIKYYKLPHGGKHRAVNKGIEEAKGELFFIVDSDDYLSEGALESILELHSKYKSDNRIAGYSFLMKNISTNQIIKPFSKNEFIDSISGVYRKGLKADRADVIKLSIIQKYKYPEIDNEWHIAPGIIFFRMDHDGYFFVYSNTVVTNIEYLSDGLTMMGDKKTLDNFVGYTIRTNELLKCHIGLYNKINICVKYIIISRKKKLSIKTISNNIKMNSIIIGLLYLVVLIRRF